MPNDTDNEGEFSDISADEEFTPIPLPSTQMTLENFRKALNSSQEKQQELLNRNKRLRLRISDLESELKLAKQTGTKGRPRKAVDSLLSHDKIVLYGKKYAIVVEPFIDSGIFMKPAPQNATYTSMSDARFSNFSEYKAGSIAELYTYLSNEAEMKEQASGYAPFRDAFVHEVRSETSTALHTIRSCAPVIFSDLNLPGELWPLNAATQRKESILVQSLLLFPEQEAPGIFLPIFYPGLVKDNNFLFMNEYLPKVR
ncbi:hypothetical protein F5879DRAFT_60632 [Lentinula edodes]|nr:hypothetical protein F5879DRAFT_60632 [Lentinula edodes]